MITYNIFINERQNLGISPYQQAMGESMMDTNIKVGDMINLKPRNGKEIKYKDDWYYGQCVKVVFIGREFTESYNGGVDTLVEIYLEG